jgi:hypothetical protein
MENKMIGKQEQKKAEDLGLVDKADRRVENIGKPKIVTPDVFNPVPKADTLCVVNGCTEPKAPAQTYVCAKHCRSN